MARFHAVIALFFLLLPLAEPAQAQSATRGKDATADLDIRIPKHLRDSIQLRYIPVPRDHRQPYGPRFDIAVAVVKARTRNPQPDPVVFIPGGPGLSGIEMYVRAQKDGSHPFDAFRADRNLVIVDPRGFGFSEPNVCEGGVEHEPLTADLPGEQEWLGKLTDCRARMLEEGIDPRTLSAQQVAHDLEWLRRILGVPRLNLFGASYGSRIAFEAIEQIPASVRSVFVFGPVPPGVFRGSGDSAVAREAIEAMFRVCAAQHACSQAYPRLRDDLRSALAHVRQTPVRVTDDLVITEHVLSQGLAQMLTSRRLGAGVPLLIHTVARGGNETISKIAPVLETSFRAGRGSPGLGLAFWCNDGVITTESSSAMQRRCERLVGAVQPRADHVDASDVPLLVTVGELDPLTPPFFARDLRAIVLPAWGHELPPDCNFRIASAFFAEPGNALDTSCIGEMPIMTFVTGVDAGDWIDDVALGPRWSRGEKVGMLVAAHAVFVVLAILFSHRRRRPDRTLPTGKP